MKSSFADYISNEIYDFYFSERTISDKMDLCGNIYKKVLLELTSNDPVYFSSYYARAVFLADKFALNEELKDEFTKIGFFTGSGKKKINLEENPFILDYCTSVLILSLRVFTGEKILTEFDSLIKAHNRKKKKPGIKKNFFEIEKKIRLLVKSVNFEENKLECLNEEFGSLIVNVNEANLELLNLIIPGMIINLLDCEVDEEDYRNLKFRKETYIVLEPDYLVDATEVSETYINLNTGLETYVLRKLFSTSASISMVSGNIINYLFDRLVQNPKIAFDEILTKAFSYKPLQAFLIKFKNGDKALSEVVRKMRKSFDDLKEIINSFEGDYFTIEPTFVSPDFGLQGRLDLMIEFKDEVNRKTIIELKSGKSPKKDIAIHKDGKTFVTGVWNNHLAQISCYNLLLDSAYTNRTGSSEILYSSAFDAKRRNVPNLLTSKQEIIALRNKMVAFDCYVANGDANLIDYISNIDEEALPVFIAGTIEEIKDAIKTLDETERDYINLFVMFIQREIFASKTGAFSTMQSKGFSSFWLDSRLEKQANYTLYSGLIVDLEATNFAEMHVVFHPDQNNGELYNLTSFRKGDIILLYPDKNQTIGLPKEHQLIKGIIKEISNESIKVSLRNKVGRETLFHEFSKWVMEVDYIDSSYKQLYHSVNELIRTNKRKRDLLLCRRAPEFNKIPGIICSYLDDNKNEVLNKALAAKDYFLIQGPPGTGKTKYMLRAIVEEKLKASSDNILVLAYTNRAVDEICAALKMIFIDSAPLEFVRTGYKDTTEHSDVSISSLADQLSLTELYNKITNSRVVVSTISAVLSGPEILDLKQFNIAIIDEASQVIEPQIVGLLCRIETFIMIGDEKQLPAVVVQHLNEQDVIPESLIQTEMQGITDSMFERLLRYTRKNRMEQAVGVLLKQARMHEDIQALANLIGYDGILSVFSFNQKAPFTNFNDETEDKMEKAMASNRLIFISVPYESEIKVNHYEAKIACDIIRITQAAYGENMTNKTIGIISPFRAQCAEIYRSLSPEQRALVSVDTVERYQGSDRDIIVASMATNMDYLIKSIESKAIVNNKNIDRKLNVTITRAKDHLIITGVADVLAKSPIYKKMIDYIKEYGLYLNYSDLYPQ